MTPAQYKASERKAKRDAGLAPLKETWVPQHLVQACYDAIAQIIAQDRENEK